jgi:hypothetical protein
MVVDANSDLIEVDDGGVYRRASPLNNTGDWFSINGDLQTTELHDVAYDINSIPVLGWKWVVRTSLKSRIKLQHKNYSDEGRPNAKHN